MITVQPFSAEDFQYSLAMDMYHGSSSQTESICLLHIQVAFQLRLFSSHGLPYFLKVPPLGTFCLQIYNLSVMDAKALCVSRKHMNMPLSNHYAFFLSVQNLSGPPG